MPFGRHVHEPIQNIPRGYLRWLADNVELHGDLQRDVTAVLAGHNIVGWCSFGAGGRIGQGGQNGRGPGGEAGGRGEGGAGAGAGERHRQPSPAVAARRLGGPVGSELRGERALEADLVTLEGFWYRRGMEARRRRIRELEGSRGA
jgi:hypothetical protein